jgi:hypothetical protein
MRLYETCPASVPKGMRRAAKTSTLGSRASRSRAMASESICPRAGECPDESPGALRNGPDGSPRKPPGRRPRERRRAGQHFVEDHAERPDVGARIDALGGRELLGGHVQARTQDGRARRYGHVRGGGRLRDAEIEHLTNGVPSSSGVTKEVAGFEVAMMPSAWASLTASHAHAPFSEDAGDLVLAEDDVADLEGFQAVRALNG